MKYRIAYDVKNRKVGCVLIQAAIGGLPSKLLHDFFPPDTWTVNADECEIYEIDESQLWQLALRTSGVCP